MSARRRHSQQKPEAAPRASLPSFSPSNISSLFAPRGGSMDGGRRGKRRGREEDGNGHWKRTRGARGARPNFPDEDEQAGSDVDEHVSSDEDREASGKSFGGSSQNGEEEGGFGHEQELAEDLNKSKKAVLSRKRRRHEERRQKKQMQQKQQQLWKLERQKALLERQLDRQKAALSGRQSEPGDARVPEDPRAASGVRTLRRVHQASSEEASSRPPARESASAAKKMSSLDVRGSVQSVLLARGRAAQGREGDASLPAVSSSSSSEKDRKAEERRIALDAAGRQLDAELAFLEAKLGISAVSQKDGEKGKKKLAKELLDDGFDEDLQTLLDDILGGKATKTRTGENKNDEAEEEDEEGDEEEEEEEDEEEDEDEEDEEEEDEEEEDEEEEDEEGDEEEEDAEDEDEEEENAKDEDEEADELDEDDEEVEGRGEDENGEGDDETSMGGSRLARENSDVKAGAPSAASAGKYLPPHLRNKHVARGADDAEEDRDQVAGESFDESLRRPLRTSPISPDTPENKRPASVSASVPLSCLRKARETATDAGRSLTQRLRGSFNRVSEGNVEVILQQISSDVKAALTQVLSSALPQPSSASSPLNPRDVRALRREQEVWFFREVNASVVRLLMQSVVESKFSTASLIATQTAVCCGLSCLLDASLCPEFLSALGRAFRKFFPLSASLSSAEPREESGASVGLYIRHILMALCFLFDFNVFRPDVFLGLLQRLSSPQTSAKGETGQDARKGNLSEFQVECLLLVLRLGGGKLRNENPALFKEAWTFLMKRVRDGEGSEEVPRDPSHEQEQQFDDLSRDEQRARLAGVPTNFQAEMRHRRESERAGSTGRLHYLVRELEELKNNKASTIHLASRASQEAMRRWLQTSPFLAQSPLRQCGGDGKAVLVNASSWEEVEQGLPASSPSLAAVSASLRSVGSSRKTLGGVDEERKTCLGTAGNEKALLDLATKLRLHSEEQKKIFLAVMSAEGPNDAVKRLLQIVPQTKQKKNFVTTAVAVLLHVSLQQAAFNPFYALVLARLCSRCSCASWQSDEEAKPENLLPSPFPPLGGAKGEGRIRERAPCACLLLPEKEGKNFRRVTQRGVAAQNSASHGFPLRRLLHLARLEAFLIRIGVVELRVTRFISFEGEKGQADAHMGLSGKLGFFLRELCVELLCSPPFASVPLPAPPSPSSPLLPFLSLSALPDVREAFLVVLEDVLLPEAKKGARKGKTKGGKTSLVAECTPGRKGKCSRVSGAVCTPVCGLRKEVINRVIWFMKKQKRYEEEDPNTITFEE
ncbi:conserved hypothetical protein [Neospora caninum Liverpool]|uniref:Uncharacterized protein n=1 Tax=Neospora caninum (strain Liverpool) TaxID=572307 RepID=F0VKK3_NEOCL|nr:conserved hypothetical protein [Neospora caninum Liverpool]CBZ54604.1 conserved hypothetical protein [Neospora caninum Liverpool]CEL69318.1 TPA: hypothetical protein BN1204_050320 [Neospora caninum Liverpool]|eukprot:XP_003884634.1 conserved hypothetical protein [Neospora caninum Liverpool]